jgi:class 3 adenylate cyclase
MGDGVLIYFGYPQAHEDDAERAVRAGLELVAAVSDLKTHASLQTRVGIRDRTGSSRRSDRVRCFSGASNRARRRTLRLACRVLPIRLSARQTNAAGYWQRWSTMQMLLHLTERSSPAKQSTLGLSF